MSTLRCYQPLKIVAHDERGLSLMSATLQDAVGKVGDIAYLPDMRRFAFVTNRFVWECAVDRRHGPFARVRAGAHFDDVLSVRQQNLLLDRKAGVVALLAVRFEAGADGGGAIILDFAGGGAIRLEVEAINGAVSDMSDPWPTASRPAHGEEAG